MKRFQMIFISCVLAVSHTLTAALELNSLFTDHMVLQRDMPVPVWGKADPGSRVSVTFLDQKKRTIADEDGRWMLELDALSASFEPHVMHVSAPGESIHISDILVGEVWICSGQSNMQFSVNGVPETRELAPHSKNIRTFEVERTVAFTEQETCRGEWVDSHPSSAVAFGFAHFLQKHEDIPVGIILTCWGSSSLEAWMPRDMVHSVPHFKTMMEEFDADTKTRDRIQKILDGPRPWPKKDDIFLRRQTNILYNAMMAPLVPYAARGLVWYQGERNTQSMHGMVKSPWFARHSGMLKYGDTLKAWIKRYREAWGRDDFHFLITMLPGYYNRPLKTGPQTGAESPIAHSWAWMRESQLKALDLPHTSVPNTVDLGDLKDVHPKDKLPIGERLAMLAARDTLGLAVEAQGPVMKHVESRANSLVVHYDYADGLKTTDGEMPQGFWIADDSEQWVPADAKIWGDTVILSSSEIEKPLFVRYAFAGKPQVNLINSVDLPAYPFRTDTFEP